MSVIALPTAYSSNCCTGNTIYTGLDILYFIYIIYKLCGVLKRQVKNHSPSSIQSLKEVILEEWKKIDHQLVHSMPRRLGAINKNHGGQTKY